MLVKHYALHFSRYTIKHELILFHREIASLKLKIWTREPKDSTNGEYYFVKLTNYQWD